MREEYNERELEDVFVEQIMQFLLELGNGFIGKQVEIKIGESNFYVTEVNKNMKDE